MAEAALGAVKSSLKDGDGMSVLATRTNRKEVMKASTTQTNVRGL